MVKPPEELGSQRWNVAKTIASKTISTVLSAVDGDSPSRSEVDKQRLNDAVSDLRSELDYWPYDDVDEVYDAVSRYSDFNDGLDEVQDLGRYVSQRLVDETDRVTPDESYEQLDLGDQQADESSDEPVDNSEESIQTNTDTVEQRDSVDRVDVGDGSETWEIAIDLYYAFLTNDIKFREVTQKYEVRFPDRTVLLTDVMNTTGSTEERISQVESMVSEWYNDDDAVEHLNQYKRKPMGA